MSYEIRPAKSEVELKTIAGKLTANHIKIFGVAPDPAKVVKWAGELVDKAQEAYVKGYIESFSIPDLLAFPKHLETEAPKDPVKITPKNSDKAPRI